VHVSNSERDVPGACLLARSEAGHYRRLWWVQFDSEPHGGVTNVGRALRRLASLAPSPLDPEPVLAFEAETTEMVARRFDVRCVEVEMERRRSVRSRLYWLEALARPTRRDGRSRRYSRRET
jgi:hypothetical protein